MGWWTDHVVPRIADRSLSTVEVRPLRARVCSGLTGEVLEVGFGSGLDGWLAETTDSVDCAPSTFTLYGIPDVEAALAELSRVLRPAGSLHFAEHGHVVP
jgi:SAM-dependent methyltransferase